MAIIPVCTVSVHRPRTLKFLDFPPEELHPEIPPHSVHRGTRSQTTHPLGYGPKLLLSIPSVHPRGLRPAGTHLSTKVMGDHPRGIPRARMDFPASIERI